MKKLDTREDVSELFDRLYPLCRSILGEGYRESLKILEEYIPLEEEAFPSGEKVLNWAVPQEWVIREAWIKDAKGNKVIDFKHNNLHVVNYSDKIDAVMDLEKLKQHIYTSDADDDAIPYTISYYKKRWGFCMSKNQLAQLQAGEYHAYIDSDYIDGNLVIGETVLPGESEKEILLTSYLCHPSMANNELSGPLVIAMLYQRMKKRKNRKFTYRFVVNPETIGSIAYLSRHGEELKKSVYAGLVFTCLGGTESLRYKTSRQETSSIDKLVAKMNKENPDTFRIEVFSPTSGSDERQYCSTGFDLPVGQMARKVYGEYKEYHTSLDTKELMGIDHIIESCDKLEAFLLRHEAEAETLAEETENSKQPDKCEGKWFYRNLYPYGEVKLGDYNLYPTLNTSGVKKEDSVSLINEPWFIRSVMMLLNYSDGECSLEYCAKRLEIEVDTLLKVADILVDRGLLEGPLTK